MTLVDQGEKWLVVYLDLDCGTMQIRVEFVEGPDHCQEFLLRC